MSHWLPPIATCAAFWLAVWLHGRRGSERRLRFMAALAAGAIAAHLGWLYLFQSAPVDRAPLGFSVLFLPMGLLLFCRSPAAFASLPLPLALARSGCLVAGCCHGAASQPLPLFEIFGLGGLHLVLRAMPEAVHPGAFLVGFAALRLAEAPLRPAQDAALLAPHWVAIGWTACGAIWLTRSATIR